MRAHMGAACMREWGKQADEGVGDGEGGGVGVEEEVMGDAGGLGKATASGCASRYRQNVATVFDALVEVAAPDGDSPPWVLWHYPEDFQDAAKLKAVCEFAYPAGPLTEGENDAVQMFTFVLTGTASDYTFGYSRHTPRSNTCLVLLCGLPWTNFFYKLLNHFASVMNNKQDKRFNKFLNIDKVVNKEKKFGHFTGVNKLAHNQSTELEALLVRAYHSEIPGPGETLLVESSLGKNKVECIAPDETKLPTLQDNKYLQDYYGCLADHSKNMNMIAIFVSLLQERRVVITGRKIGQVSHCVLAAERLIYPLFWQYPFIPVLTKYEFLHCPTPFLVGVPSPIFARAASEVDMSEVVVVDIDAKTFHSPLNDISNFPQDIMKRLKSSLRGSNHLLGDGLARSFLRALVELLGGYRAGLHRPIDGAALAFDFERFLALYDRRPNTRAYLAALQASQVVQQFLDERVGRLNSGQPLNDAFEEERRNFADRLPKTDPRDIVRERSMEAFSGFHERFKTIAKEGTSRAGSAKPSSVASLVQDKLHRIPSFGGGSGHKLVNAAQTKEPQPVVQNGKHPATDNDESTNGVIKEGTLLNLDDEPNEPPSTAPSTLHQVHSSKSLSDLLPLGETTPVTAVTARTGTPPLIRNTAPYRPSPLAGPVSNAISTKASVPAKTTIPTETPPSAKTTPDQNDLIDWAADDRDPILEFDPLAPAPTAPGYANVHQQQARHPAHAYVASTSLLPNASAPDLQSLRPLSSTGGASSTGSLKNWETFE